MDTDEWCNKWDASALYGDAVKGCDTCVEGSPIASEGVVCGPILRLTEVDYDGGWYNGSVLVIVKNGDGKEAPVVSYRRGPVSEAESGSVSEEEKLQVKMFHKDELAGDKFYFYRYTVRIPLEEYDQLVRYSLDGEWCEHYRFYIPAKSRNFNVIAYSCNGFSLTVDTSVFKGSMWFDILRKHADIHYNVMLGGGDQIYSDSIRIACSKIDKWLEIKDPIRKATTKVTPAFRIEMENFYLREYVEWYGYGHWRGGAPNSKTTQRCFPLAMASIPSINIWDDHDIIDGFGSYRDSFMKTDVFSSIGKAAFKYYMLFQHHVSMDDADDVDAYLKSKHWILGAQNGPYMGQKSHSVLTRLGPNMAMLGLDCRTERKLKEIVSPQTYDLVFQRLEQEAKKGGLDHLLVMLGVPIAYPRLVWLEWLFSSRLLAPIKYLSKKGIIAKGLLNDFNGDVELLDDLNDHWCARHHKRERNYFIARLQDFGARYGIRVTILSGDVHLAAVGRFRSKLHSGLRSSHDQANQEIITKPELDTRLMLNIVSSAVVNTPPPDAMTKLLQKRAPLHNFDADTQEDVLPLFERDTDGKTKRVVDSFLNKRNWSDVIPVANVLGSEYLSEALQIKPDEVLVPSIAANLHSKPSSKSERYQAYPVTPKGLISSIHVEKDRGNVNSETAWYVIPVPDLQTKGQKLDHTGMKHRDV